MITFKASSAPAACTVTVPELVAGLWEARYPDIVRLGHPALRVTARPVAKPTPETRRLVDRMKAAMQAEHGIGLAAPQVGVDERVIIYRLPEDNAPIHVMVNPRIVSAKGEQTGIEGCLSLPFLHGEVTRANEIIVKAMDMLGRPIKRRASELEARVIQHEMDHLDGILFIDRADPDTLHWDLPESALGPAPTDSPPEPA
jgi:peptide deformylase